MQQILITGGTGSLGSVVVPRLQRDYDTILLGRPPVLPHDGPQYHALVMLAGGFAMGNAWEQMIEMNLMSVARAVDVALPRLKDGGRVVAISAAASLTSPPGIVAYSATKSAVNSIIRTLANELAPRKITANALLPTTIDDRLKTNIAEWIAFLLSERGDGVTGQLIAVS